MDKENTFLEEIISRIENDLIKIDIINTTQIVTKYGFFTINICERF